MSLKKLRTHETWWKNFNHEQLLELLNHVPLPKMYDQELNNSLHFIAKTDNDFIASKLLRAGCDKDERNHDGDTPLAIALLNRNAKVAKVLLDAGADHKKAIFKNKRSPLHVSVRNGFVDVVKMLLDAGANVNAADSDGQIPLHDAILTKDGMKQNDRCKIVKMLIKAGSNINEKDDYGDTPLHYAINSGFVEAFEMLLHAGADIHEKNRYGQSLLYLAVENDALYFVKRLIEIGVDINGMNEQNITCLHWAAAYTRVDMLQLLLENGAVANFCDADHYSPLCYYLRELRGLHMTFTEDLYPMDENYDDYFECQLPGKINQHSKCMELLLEHGANVNCSNCSAVCDDSPLYVVLSNVYLHSQFLKFLLQNGATFDFKHQIVLNLKNKFNGSKYRNMLVRHQAMFEANNRKDGPTNFKLHEQKKQVQTYYARCRDELELMRSSQISDTNITFFHMLLDRNIGCYTRIENIEDLFKMQCITKRFPIYSDLLIERFTKAFEHEKLIVKATTGLAHLLHWNVHSMRVILDNIISYVGKRDLLNLVSL
ncbi:tankyrase-1-like [Copidosoma floridanum]|uniref:tankyrase-1-like n=1 Tax=Copidosoma floridanum TaxID=29053 RepID=UPI0006C979C7|nr:tankyrase-1-like [Copidosoma floridanum]